MDDRRKGGKVVWPKRRKLRIAKGEGDLARELTAMTGTELEGVEISTGEGERKGGGKASLIRCGRGDRGRSGGGDEARGGRAESLDLLALVREVLWSKTQRIAIS